MSDVPLPAIKNVSVSGREVNLIGQVHNHVANAVGPLRGLDLLISYCVSSALLDSKQRFTLGPPRCAKHTRKAILQAFIDWINSENASASMAWLRGPAGAGKSAIAQTLGEICTKLGLLAASFFFSNIVSSESNNGDLLIPTIVFQLVQCFPQLREFVDKAIKNDPLLFSKSLQHQLQRLLLEPLNQMKGNRKWDSKLFKSKKQEPRLIIIDALDECRDADVQVELLRIIAQAIPQFLQPFRFLIVSRPEAHIVHAFQHNPVGPVPLHCIDLTKDPSAEGDIRLFLEQQFALICQTHPRRLSLPATWPTPVAINTLVARSSGQFIYADTAMKYVQAHRRLPHEQLEVILNLDITPVDEAPLARLDALYTFILSKVEAPYVNVIARLFSLLLLGKIKSSDDVRPTFSVEVLVDILGLRNAGELANALEPLLSLLEMPENTTQEIILFHASLLDFLCDHRRSVRMKHRVGEGLGHETLALHHWKELESDSSVSHTHLWFLYHFQYAEYSEELQKRIGSYSLPTFDCLLLLKEQWKILWDVITLLLFVVVYKERSSIDCLSLHTHHATNIMQRFVKNRQHQGNPFKDQFLQSRHQVYDAFLSALIQVADSSAILNTLIASRCFFMVPPAVTEHVRKHLFVVLGNHKQQAAIHLSAKDLILWGRKVATGLQPQCDELDNAVLCTARHYLKMASAEDSEVVQLCRDIWKLDER